MARNSGGACSPGPAYQQYLSGVQRGPRVLSLVETVWRLVHIMSLFICNNGSGDSCLCEKGHRPLDSDPSFVLGKSPTASLGFGFPICTLWVTNLPCKSVMRAPGDTHRMAAVVILMSSTALLIALSLFLPMNPTKLRVRPEATLLTRVSESGRTQPWASTAPWWDKMMALALG